MRPTLPESHAPPARRALLYSHDTFGLGHLRRSRTIAQGLVDWDPSLAALILTGSPIAGRFDFPDRVDHVRLPGVVKLPDGDYASHNLGLPLEETVSLRAGIICATERGFVPDLLIVDKEAWGFRNELAGALDTASRRGARIVLGVRDVLDEPAALREEWERKGHLEAIERYFDEIWVYGLPQMHRPLEGLDLPRSVAARVRYTGYLRREPPDWPELVGAQPSDEPFRAGDDRRRRRRRPAGGLGALRLRGRSGGWPPTRSSSMARFSARTSARSSIFGPRRWAAASPR